MTKLVRPCSSVVERLLNLALGARVDAARGLVQDQDARVGQRDAGDGQQLALALAQAAAALAEHGLVAVCAARAMNSSARASLAAAITSSSVASGRP